MAPQVAVSMAAGGEGHRADLRIEVGERHPHRDGVLGVERPIELVLMPRGVTAAGLLEQRLIVIQPNAVDAEQVGRRLGEPG